MKRSVLFILLLMSAVSLKAQWSVTPEAGMTAVNRAESFMDSWRPGWKIGVGVEYDLNERFSLKSGVYYTQRGYFYHYLGPYYYYDYSSGYSEPDYTCQNGKINQHFLQIPVMAKYSWNLMEDVKLNIAVGPYVAFRIGDSWSYGAFSIGEYGGYGDGGGYGNYRPAYDDRYPSWLYTGYGYSGYYNNSGYNSGGDHSFDWGLSASVGIEVKNWVANLGYDLSLSKEACWDDIGANYHTISLSVGYKFQLGK